MKKMCFRVLSVFVFVIVISGGIVGCDGCSSKSSAPSKSAPAPKTPGVYNVLDKDGKSKYVGESVDMKKRTQDHKRSGKFEEGDKANYIEMPGSTSDERRQREKEEIEKNKPYMNKSKGGEGRKAE